MGRSWASFTTTDAILVFLDGEVTRRQPQTKTSRPREAGRGMVPSASAAAEKIKA